MFGCRELQIELILVRGRQVGNQAWFEGAGIHKKPQGEIAVGLYGGLETRLNRLMLLMR